VIGSQEVGETNERTLTCDDVLVEVVRHAGLSALGWLSREASRDVPYVR